MPKLRNPGLYSVVIFAILAAFVVFLYVVHADDAGKMAGQLFALAVAAFGARSALESRGALIKKTTASVETRAKMNTWPEITPTKTIDVDLEKDGDQ